MSIKKIIIDGDDILHLPSEPVSLIDDSVHGIVQDLRDTLDSTTGIGLSAPQIGISKRIFIFDVNRMNNQGKYNVLINPTIIRKNGSIVSEGEGCKSTPGLRVDVKRSAIIDVEGLDEAGQFVSLNAEGLEAIVIQHEIDHLDGKLLTDKLNEKDLAAYKRQLNSIIKNSSNPAYFNNINAIRNRLQFLNDHKQGTVCLRNTKQYQIIVEKVGTQIQLYFAKPDNNINTPNISGIMSRVDIEAPLNLLGRYTQAMILNLLWKPNPNNIYIMGFGGGRIPMIFHHYFPELVIESTEIDPAVLDITMKYFGISLDDRMKVYIEDARGYLARQPASVKYDIIIVDCFTGVGLHPFLLSTSEFYFLCKDHLVDGGVVATNIVESDPLFKQKIHTMVSSFRYVWRFNHPDVADVFFGCDEDIQRNELTHRANELFERYCFEFPFCELLQYLNILTSKDTASFGSLLTDSMAIQKLQRNDPIFSNLGRNDPCPCGSGKKFKKCHGFT